MIVVEPDGERKRGGKGDIRGIDAYGGRCRLAAFGESRKTCRGHIRGRDAIWMIMLTMLMQ